MSLGRITLTRSLLFSLLKRQGNLCSPSSYYCVNAAKNSEQTAFPSSSLRGCSTGLRGKVILVFSGDFLTGMSAVRLGPLCFPALWLKGSCSRHSSLLHPSAAHVPGPAESSQLLPGHNCSLSAASWDQSGVAGAQGILLKSTKPSSTFLGVQV